MTYCTDEDLSDLLARFPAGRHPKIHAALEELRTNRKTRYISPRTSFEIEHQAAIGPEGDVGAPLSTTIKIHVRPGGISEDPTASDFTIVATGPITIERRPYEGPK